MIKIKTGIDGLDRMLEGGLIPGRVYYLEGSTGTGKTLILLRFLYEGLRAGEKCLYISADRPPSQVIKNASQSFGWNLSNLSVMDAVPTHALFTSGPVHDITAKGEISYANNLKENVEKGELTLDSLHLRLAKEAQEVKYNRIVLDSLSILKKYGIDAERKHETIHKLNRLLVEMKTTAMISLDDNIDSIETELLLSNGFIKLEKEKKSENTTICVLKYRGSKFDSKPHILYISKDGLKIE